MSEAEVEIAFLCDEKYSGVFSAPLPASKFLPEYYKDMPGLSAGSIDRPVFNSSGEPSQTMKKCMPVLDSMSMGYVIPILSDIYCESTGDFGKSFTWSADDFVAIESHPEGQFPGLPIPEEYDSIAAYKFINPWQVVTPPGYSCLFIQPMWHYDLPYHVFPGVVDTDQHPVAVNFPFVIRKNFEGYIRRGTPMVQVIPFKREEFTSLSDVRPESENKRWKMAKTQFNNNYKDFFRSPKIFR